MREYFSKHAGPSFQLILLVIFIFTCIVRGQYIGELSNRQHVWLTASTAKFTDIWINEGAMRSDFLLIEEPASIDKPAIVDRKIYSSQPPGSIVPIYILKRIFPFIDTILLIHLYSLLNHFLIALTGYWIVVRLLKEKLKDKLSHFYGLLAGSSYLLIPATLYWHSIIYFTDIAIILPFAIVILLETHIRINKNKDIANSLLGLQSLALFVMALVEYFAIPTAISLFIFRIFIRPKTFSMRRFESLIKNFIQLLIPIIIALSLFLIQLSRHSQIKRLYERFELRSGLNTIGKEVLNIEGLIKLFSHLGWIYGLLTLLSVLYIFDRCIKYRKPEFVIPACAFSCSILQISLVLNHSIIHSFSVLKLYFPLCISFFGIIPAILPLEKSRIKSYEPREWITNQFFAYSLILIIGLPSLNSWYKNPELLFTSTAKAIGNIFSYEDILFGFDGFSIKDNPPHYLALSKKLVEGINKEEEINSKVKDLPSASNVYFLYKETSLGKDKECDSLREKSFPVGFDNISAFKVQKESAIDLFKECHPI